MTAKAPPELPVDLASGLRRLKLSTIRQLILVLLAAAALTLVMGDLEDAVIITSVVLVNTCVGVVQEVRASKAVAALSALAAPSARVRRDGVTQSVAADPLVPGDVVELAEGDVIPADCQLLDASALLVDEAALTGESVPVEKTPGSGPSAYVEDGRLSAGAVVAGGRAVGVVSATGAESAMDRIAALMDTELTMTPLQHRLAGLCRVLTIAAGALCLVVAVRGLVRGAPLDLMAVTAISLVVAAVPESLPAVVTLSLALGAKRMASRRAIVRRLAAAETLGAVTILATDNTGTLTEGRMVAEVLWTPVGEATVTGTGYAPVGEIHSSDGPRTAVTGTVDVALVALLKAAVVCNDATLEPPEATGGIWNAVGDPTRGGPLGGGGQAGSRCGNAGRPTGRRAALRQSAAPDDHPARAGERVVTGDCKGAPEVLLLPTVDTAGGAVIHEATNRAQQLGEAGYRVLAVAQTVLDDRPLALVAAETGLELPGMVAIADPPRDGAAETIAACREAGITTVLITGDHPPTARTIAERLGIFLPGDVVAGDDLEVPGVTPRDDARVRVYARSTPSGRCVSSRPGRLRVRWWR